MGINPLWLLQWYIRALLKGNPFAVAIAVAGAVALGMGPFAEGIKRRDPVAIGLLIGVVAMFAIVVVVAIVDRKMNAPKKRSATARESKGGRSPRPAGVDRVSRPGPNEGER